MYSCKKDEHFSKLLFIRNFIFIGFFIGFLCLVSCGGSKHTRCYAYSAEKKATATDDSSPFAMKSKKGSKSFFSFFGGGEEKSPFSSKVKNNNKAGQGRFLIFINKFLPKKKEKSPFERKKKKEKKKKHKEGLFPQEMIRKK